MGAADPANHVRRLVTDRLREWHHVEPGQVVPDRPLAELGLTSRDAVALAAEISELTGLSLPATLLWEAPTLEALTRRVREAASLRRNGDLVPRQAHRHAFGEDHAEAGRRHRGQE